MAKKPSKYPEEQRLSDLIKSTRDSASDPITDGQAKKISDLKKQLGGMKFQRLVTKRVIAALKQIGNVGALAGKSYSYTTAQATEVTDALAGAVEAVHAAFANPAKKNAPVFKLSQ